MKPVEIEFIMKDKLSGGMDKIGASATSMGARTAQSSRQITSQLDDVSRGIATSGSVAETEGKKIEGMFKSATSAALAYFTVNQAYSFASDIARVRGEFQQLDVAFSTLLQSKEKADILMAQMVDLAARTPFKLTDVATGAKQLVAYGFAAEEINGTLIRLGNIASGLNLPMERLTYLYGTTMTQGRLYARDMMQFTTSGIPMLQGLADMYGITTDKIDEMVTAGKIGFPEVKQVIENMTNEGGKFYNLMELQSKTITGKISNLGDAIDVMYNKMGQSQEGVINSAIDSAKYLVDNYEKVGSIITTLIATYGTYKTAVIVLSAVEKARLAATLSGEAAVCIATRQVTAMQALRYMATMKLKTAQELLNVTMAKNLIGIAVAALAVGTYSLVKAITKETEAEKALREEQERKLERNNNYLASMSKEQAEVDILFGRLKALTAGTKAYNDTKNDIISKYGQYLKGLGDEIESLQNVEGAYKAISAAAVQAARDRAISEVTSASAGEYAKVEAENLRGIRTLLADTKGALDGEKIFTSLKESLRTGTEFSDEVKSAIGYTAEWGRETTVVYDKVVPRMKGIFESLIYGIKDSKSQMNTEIKEVEDILGGVFLGQESGATNSPTQLHTIIADIKSQQTELKKLNAQASWSSDEAKRIGELNESLGELKKQYKSFTGKDYDQKPKKTTAEDKASNSYIKMQEKLREQSDAIYLETWQNRIDIQKEGFDKQMAQLELNYSKELMAIEKFTRDQIKLYQDAEREKYKSENKGSDKGFVATTQTYEDLPKDVLANISARGLAATISRNNAEKALIEDILKKYQGYTEQRTKLETDFQKDYDRLTAQKNGTNDALIDTKLSELEYQKTEAIKSIDEQFAMREDSFNSWVDSIADLSLEKLEDVLKKAEKELAKLESNGDGDSKTLSVARAKVSTAKKKVSKAKADNETSPDKRSIKEWENLYKTLNDINSEFESIGETAGGTAGDIIKTAGSIASSTLSMIGSIMTFATASATATTTTATTAATAIKTVEQASVILAIIGAALQIITAMFSLFKKDDYMEKFRAEVAKLNYDLALLKLNAMIDSDEPESVFGDDLWTRAIKNVDAARDALALYDQTLNKIKNRNVFRGFFSGFNKEYENVESSIADMQLQTRHSTWFRDAKYTSLKDAVPELFNADGSINKDALGGFVGSDTFKKLSGANQQYLQEMADYWASYQEAVGAVKDYLSDIFGDLGENISDALVDAFENGTDAGKAFADSVSDMLETLAQQMIYSVTIAPLMEAAEKKMLDTMSDLSLSDEEKFLKQAEILAELTKNAVSEQEKANEMYQIAKDAAASQGIDIFEPERETQSGNAGGGFETMTQEQGTKLEGLFTSAQMHLSSIDERMEYEAVAMHAAADQLTEIAANTAYCKYLKEIKEYIEYMKTNGIKVK